MLHCLQVPTGTTIMTLVFYINIIDLILSNRAVSPVPQVTAILESISFVLCKIPVTSPYNNLNILPNVLYVQ